MVFPIVCAARPSAKGATFQKGAVLRVLAGPFLKFLILLQRLPAIFAFFFSLIFIIQHFNQDFPGLFQGLFYLGWNVRVYESSSDDAEREAKCQDSSVLVCLLIGFQERYDANFPTYPHSKRSRSLVELSVLTLQRLPDRHISWSHWSLFHPPLSLSLSLSLSPSHSGSFVKTGSLTGMSSKGSPTSSLSSNSCTAQLASDTQGRLSLTIKVACGSVWMLRRLTTTERSCTALW